MRQHLIFDADDTLWENNIYFERAFESFVAFLNHSSMSAGEIREVREEDLRQVMGFAERILECPMEVIPGVAETLEYLAGRHDLTLFTKGHAEEQKLKLDRSGLARFFSHTAIVREKDAPAYRQLVEERSLNPGRTWMIGNSPKSDINPALESGLNAVFVPHAHTWRLEHEEVREGSGRLLRIEKFAELREYF